MTRHVNWTSVDQEQLEQYYIHDFRSIKYIAGRMGISKNAIRYRLEQCGLLRPPSNSGWSQEDLEKLWELIQAEYSPREIAFKMNRTKNSIIGKAHRLGWGFKNKPILGTPSKKQGSPISRAQPKPNKPPRLDMPKVKANKRKSFRYAAREPQGKGRIVRKEIAKPKEFDTTLPEKGKCKYANGNGAPWDWCQNSAEPGSPWCTTHREIVYEKPTGEE